MRWTILCCEPESELVCICTLVFLCIQILEYAISSCLCVYPSQKIHIWQAVNLSPKLVLGGKIDNTMCVLSERYILVSFFCTDESMIRVAVSHQADINGMAGVAAPLVRMQLHIHIYRNRLRRRIRYSDLDLKMENGKCSPNLYFH